VSPGRAVHLRSLATERCRSMASASSCPGRVNSRAAWLMHWL